MKRPRLRKWAKWTCTLVAVLVASAAVFSRFWSLTYASLSTRGDAYRSIVLQDGVFCVGGTTDPRTVSDVASSAFAKSASHWHIVPAVAWYWGFAGEASAGGGRLGDMGWRGGVRTVQRSGLWVLGTSLIYPILLFAVPAAFLWYKDRGFGPHHCGKCGYNREGLAADSPCPECGAKP